MSTSAGLREFEGQGEVLKPYVPRILIEWVHDSPEIPYRQVEGSLAFVDISGFTALTERLARRGKVGAELLRDTLDGVFNALLDEAYQWGAGLIKWGGDALLLLFDGPGHEARAARSAWEMQRTIERVGRLRVGGGTVTLRMSIGITSGPIDFFTAGSVHRELLVVGPTATETAEIEAVAEAGEIGISQALARHLDPSCVGPPREGALLLVAPPEADRQRAPDVGAVSGLDVASCIPIASRAHVLLERSEPEHRTITAAFIDLMDTDVLLERLGPAEFAEAIEQRISLIQEAALRYEVPFNLTDISKGSVKTLLTAGAPSSTGHDEEQMLRALREVMDEPEWCRCESASTPAGSSPGTSVPATAARTACSATRSTRLRGSWPVPSRGRSSRPRSCSSARAPPLRRRRSSRSWPRARPSPSQPRSSGRSSGEGASATRRRPSSAGTPSSQFCSASSKTSGKEKAGSSRSAAPPAPAGRVSSRSSSTALPT